MLTLEQQKEVQRELLTAFFEDPKMKKVTVDRCLKRLRQNHPPLDDGDMDKMELVVELTKDMTNHPNALALEKAVAAHAAQRAGVKK
jgi:hypothetical protein